MAKRKGRGLVPTKKAIMSYYYATYFHDFKNFFSSVNDEEFSLIFDEVLELCDYRDENKELIRQFPNFREILSASLDTQAALVLVIGTGYGDFMSDIVPELYYKEERNLHMLLLKEAKRLRNFEVGFKFYAEALRDVYKTKENYRVLVYRNLLEHEEKLFSSKRMVLIKDIEHMDYEISNIPLFADFAGHFEFGFRRYFSEVYANAFF